MTVIPLDDRIIVRPVAAPHEYGWTNATVATADDTPMRGTVIAVGTGALDGRGQNVPPAVQAGDTILFGRHLGSEVTFGGIQYWIMKADDIVKIEVRAVVVLLHGGKDRPVRNHPV